jgi:5-methyltetrahydrofolate--homocysteine methyltransferase
MTTWSELLAQPGAILADGAMGTMLMANGLAFGNSPELWNVDEPQRVGEVHAAYVQAGARILLTNTFGGNRFRLQLHNLQERAAELNRAAARLAREAAGGAALVAGDIGPSGGILSPLGELEPEAAVDGFAEQAAALVEGEVDVIWLETMSSLEEMRAAIDGVRRASAGIPIITTMTFDTRGRTMMGVTPERAAQTLSGWGAVAVGGNCGNGPEEILEVVAKMRAMAPAVTLVAKANAGVPHLLAGRPVYGAGPDDMARYAIAAVEAGARVIGACCGSTPDHLRAMRDALAAKGLL